MRLACTLLILGLLFAWSAVPSQAAYREVECRLLKEGEPCQWVYKDDPFPPALKQTVKASPTKKKYAASRHNKLISAQKLAPKVQTPIAAVKPASEPQLVQPVHSNPTPPTQKQARPGSLLPSYMNIGAELEADRQIKSDPIVTSQPVDQKPAPDSENPPILSGHVVEKQVARPMIVQATLPGPSFIHKKRSKGHLSKPRRHREKLTPEHSWLAKLSATEAVQLSQMVASIIQAEAPAQNAIIALSDPPLKQTGNGFHAALVYTLRVSGYSVAGQDIDLPGMHPVRYRITRLGKNLMLHVKVDDAEVLRVYQRSVSGNLVAISPLTTVQADAR